MVTASDLIQDLNDMPSEELRLLMAHIAGIHVERHGGEQTARALTRIAYAILHHFDTASAA
jgi:hypothetical protein